MKKVIKETSDYELQVGPSVEGPQQNCYLLVNKVYNVVEVETQLLPQAYEYLDQLQSGIDARKDSESIESQKSDSVIPIFN